MTQKVKHYIYNKHTCPYQSWVNNKTPIYTSDQPKVDCKWCRKSIDKNITTPTKKTVKLIQMVGLPASGKSTYLKTNHKDCVIVSLDDIRRVFFGHQFHQNAEPFVIGTAKNMVRILLEQGKSVVIDSTGLLYQFRKEWRALGDTYGASYRIVWINTPYEKCVEQNKTRTWESGKRVPDEVLERMWSQLEEPRHFEAVPVGMTKIKVTEIKWKHNK